MSKKYRIVQKGNKLFKIQKWYLFFWWDYMPYLYPEYSYLSYAQEELERIKQQEILDAIPWKEIDA